MRELVFKNLNVPKSRKKVISIEETINKDGFLSKTAKKSIYFIRNIIRIRNNKDFENWIKQRKQDPHSDKKRFHIMKKHSDRENNDKVFCKARGSFYAIIGMDIYNIIFVHSVKMEITPIKKRK